MPRSFLPTVEKVARYLEAHEDYALLMAAGYEDRLIVVDSRIWPDRDWLLPAEWLWDEDDMVIGTVVFDA